MKPVTRADSSIAWRTFFSRIKIKDGCWEWSGCKDAKGYGRFSGSRDGRCKSWKAHRLSFMFFHGEVPAGMLVCHRCNNPSCVNPAHLYAGSHLDNIRDMVRAGTHRGMARGNMLSAKLNREQVEEIRAAYARGGITMRQLGILYSVSSSAIHWIIKGVSFPVQRELVLQDAPQEVKHG